MHIHLHFHLHFHLRNVKNLHHHDLHGNGTGEWDFRLGLCVESETARVRCGNGGSSCVLDDFVQEEDTSIDVHGRPVGCRRRDFLFCFAVAKGPE